MRRVGKMRLSGKTITGTMTALLLLAASITGNKMSVVKAETPDFTVGGITYHVIDESKNTVSVVSADSSIVKGTVLVGADADNYGSAKVVNGSVSYTVEAVGDTAFKNCMAIDMIIFGPDITSFGNDILSGCNYYKSGFVVRNCSSTSFDLPVLDTGYVWQSTDGTRYTQALQGVGVNVNNVGYYTVTFKYNGDDNNTKDKVVNVTNGEKLTKPFPDPTKNGYAFKGWAKEQNPQSDNALFDFDTILDKNSVYLYAWWDNGSSSGGGSGEGGSGQNDNQNNDDQGNNGQNNTPGGNDPGNNDQGGNGQNNNAQGGNGTSGDNTTTTPDNGGSGQNDSKTDSKNDDKKDETKKTDSNAGSGSVVIKAAGTKIAKGKKIALSVEFSDDIANKSVIWSVDNEQIASVDPNGLVTAKRAGKVTVTAALADNKDVTASYTLQVVKKPVKKIKLSGKKSLKVGKATVIKAKFTPAKGISKELEWTSSDPSVATVSAKGKVKALKKGTVKITAKATDGSGKKKTFKIKVK